MRTEENLLSHEFIGLDTTIVKSTDPTLKGLSGRIVDETRNMFVVKTANKTKMISKNICELNFNIKEKSIDVQGRSLIKRPEDRLGGRKA